MGMTRTLGVLAASIALLAAATPGSAFERPTHHRYHVRKPVGCPLRRTIGGTIVDCQGWRLRSNATGWDNTCFDLDYLPSMFACSSGRR